MNTISSLFKGNVFGAMLLIAGSCIGAGMLGLPVLSATSGYVPSFIMFILSWVFMLSTGLLLLEASLWYKEDVHIISLADKTLGFLGKAISWSLFLFLFYSLMIAYVLGSGALLNDFNLLMFNIQLPIWLNNLLMMLVFGSIVYIGTKAVDYINRYFMLGLIVSYGILVSLGIWYIKKENLIHSDWSSAYFVLPAMVVSFGFHNLIPSITSYLNRDGNKIFKAVLVGSFLPLIIYLLWQLIILGIIPKSSLELALANGDTATHALKNTLGASSFVDDVAQFFAFFAIVTSFLGVALSFVDFLSDGLNIPKKGLNKLLLCALAIAPPYFFSLIHPDAFLNALNYAGGFGAVIIFGMLPVLIVWIGRYKQNRESKQFLPGGKLSLIAVFLFASFIFGLQFYRTFLS